MKKLLTLCLIHFTFISIAQQQYTITNYTQEQGLPSGTIRGIYNDTTGYIWFTSEGAIARFDGYTYKTYRYNPDKPTSLPGNFLWEETFTKFGDIYFGREKANFLFNSATESFKAPFGDSVEIFSITEAKDVKGCYWLRTKDTIYRISKNRTERFSLPYTIPKEWLMRTSPSNCCLLYNERTKDILYFDYQKKQFSKPKIPDHKGIKDSTSVAEVIFTDNNFYLFTSKSIYRFDSTSKSFKWHLDLKHIGKFDYNFRPYLSFNDSLVVVRSKSGFINILNIRTGEEKLVYVNKKIPEATLNDRFILTSVPDNNNAVWLGTNNMGLIYYNIFTGELEQFIHEPNNPIAIGSNSLPGNFVSYVMPGENGVVWASCYGHGIVKMERLRDLFKTAIPVVIKKTGSPDQGGAWSESIRGFLATKDGYWIGTLNGLYGYSNETHEFSNLSYLCPISDTTNNVYTNEFTKSSPVGSLAEDHSGNLWIGTWYGELVVYNTKLKRAFPFRRPEPMKEREKDGVFRNLFCDSKNRMWISTQSAGVTIVDCNALNFENINDLKFEYNFHDDKDSTSIIKGIAFVVTEDADGNIWAGTENGLCKYNEKIKKWKRFA